MHNNALKTNAAVFRNADLSITTRGSDWYFTVCAIMSVSLLAVMGFSFRRPATHRLFHNISAAILLVAAIAYFSMGSGLGQVPVQVEFQRPGDRHVKAAGTREMFYVRYIDWFVTTPLLLLDLLLTAGMSWPSIAMILIADEVMIVCGLVGALIQTSYKWGFWTFGTVAFLFVAYSLAIEGRQHANRLGGPIKSTFFNCGVLTLGIWLLYPIAWGCAEGGNVIHPDSEAVFYGILDIIAKPVFTFLLLFGHRNIDPAQLGLRTRLATDQAAIRREKNGLHHNGHHNGMGTTDAAHDGNGVATATPANGHSTSAV